jgi:pimeloyl-ACP methyl ester carboxylesterase
MLELSGLAAGVAMSDAVQAAAPAKPVSGSRVVTRDGIGLHCSDWGRGKVMVFVHSWAFNSRMWDYQVAAFTRAGWRCVVYDRRGHGRSDLPGWGYDYNTLSDDLAAVIDSIGTDKVVLVAHSMGGGEVIRYLTRHGASKVSRVVLLAPTAPGIARSSTNPTGVDLQILESMRNAWRRDFPHWIDENTDAFFTPTTSPGMKRWLAHMMGQTPLQVAITCSRSLAETDFRAELPTIRTPMLILHGDQDKSAPIELTGRQTAALVPGAQFEVVEGAPHGLFVTHCDQVNSGVLKFLAA